MLFTFLDGVVDAGRELVVALAGVDRHVAGLAVGDGAGGLVVVEHDLADVRGVAAGLDDRASVVGRIGVRVLHVRVRGEDHVDRRVGVVDDLLEHRLAAFCSSMVGLAVASSSLEAAPSWYSATITSASPFDSSPSVS